MLNISRHGAIHGYASPQEEKKPYILFFFLKNKVEINVL